MALEGRWSQVRLFREAHLDSPRECTEWCMSVGLLRGQKECRRHRRAMRLVERPERAEEPLYWYCGKCSSRVSVTAGSVFESLSMSIGRALMLLHQFASGAAYEEAQLAVVFDGGDEPASSATVADWYGLARDRLVDEADRIGEGGQIGGPGVVVQVDEAQIGRRKWHRGRVPQDVWVLGAIDEAGGLRMRVVPDRSSATLNPILGEWCRPGSVLHTDGWRAYGALADPPYNFTHRVVNHSLRGSGRFVAPDGTNTQRVECEWRHVRRTFSPGGRRKEDIADLLVEHIWRRQCRQLNRDPFADLVRLFRAT